MRVLRKHNPEEGGFIKVARTTSSLRRSERAGKRENLRLVEVREKREIR